MDEAQMSQYASPSGQTNNGATNSVLNNFDFTAIEELDPSLCKWRDQVTLIL